MDITASNPKISQKSDHRGPNGYLWLAGLVLFIASLLVSGYQLYSNNHAMQIPYVQRLVDPSLFPDDPFIKTFDNYIGPIWQIIAFSTAFVRLETTLLILFLITRALILLAAARLSQSLVPGSNLAAVGAMAFFALAPSPVIGHGTLVINYFEHTGLSVAFLMLAAAAFYSKRTFLWSIFFAVGFNLNILYGTYACLYFAAVFLLLPEYRTYWKKWLIPAGIFFGLSLITIIPTASSAKLETINAGLWLKASRVRHPFHIFPLTWSALQIIVYSAFVLVFLIVILAFRKEMSKLSNFGLIWLAVSIFWLIFAFTAAYFFKSPAMLILQSTRGTDLWFATAAVAIISIFAYKISEAGPYQRLYIILFYISIFWLNYFYFSQLTMLFLLVLTALVFLKPTREYMQKHGVTLVLSSVVVLMVLVFGILSVNNRLNEGIRCVGMLKLPDAQMVEIAGWAGKNTGKGAVFLVDPNWEEFRGLSKRPVFVAWKDGTAIFWDQAYVQEWVERIEAFGFDFNEAKLGTTKGSSQLSRLYERMDDESVREILGNYPVHYWVAAVDKTSTFPEVFRTVRFKVLELNP